MLPFLYLTLALVGAVLPASAGDVTQCLAGLKVSVPTGSNNGQNQYNDFGAPISLGQTGGPFGRGRCDRATNKRFTYELDFPGSGWSSSDACDGLWMKLALTRGSPSAQPIDCAYRDIGLQTGGGSFNTLSGVDRQYYCDINGDEVLTESGSNNVNRIVVTVSSEPSFPPGYKTKSGNFFFTVSGASCSQASGKYRRRQEVALGLPPANFRCLSTSIACPAAGRPGLWQCLPNDNIESCGGCPGSSEAKDCTEIDGVDGVQCVNSTCRVLSCNTATHHLVDGVCVPGATPGSRRKRANGPSRTIRA